MDWTKLETDGIDIPHKGEVYHLAKGWKQVMVLAAEEDVLYQVILTQRGEKPRRKTFESCSTTRFVAEYRLAEKTKRDYA